MKEKGALQALTSCPNEHGLGPPPQPLPIGLGAAFQPRTSPLLLV